MPAAFKLLAPEELAAAVIGKGGAVITAMRERTKAKVSLSDNKTLFPGTWSRLMKVEAPTAEAVADCVGEVLEKLEGCAKATPSEEIGSAENLKLMIVMPRSAVGGLIGKGGAAIRQLQESSGARISVRDSVGKGAYGDQVVSLSGPKASLEEVIATANKEVQALSEEDWFSAWISASVPTGGDSGWSDWEPPSKGKVKGKGKGKDKGGWSYDHPGVSRMMDVAYELPPYVMEESRGFCVSSVVPSRLTGGLIGRNGVGIQQVEARTGCKIAIREIPDEPEHQNMIITGPLSDTCAAYMLMMRRYIEAEQQAGS